MIRFGRSVPGDVEQRLRKLVGVFASDPRLDALWLFGSRARGEADALSDIDLAVLASANTDPASLWDLQLKWTGKAVEILATDEVAITVLNRARVTIREAVLRDARLLWARSSERVADFDAATAKEYLDIKPHLEAYDRDLLHQAAAGRLR